MTAGYVCVVQNSEVDYLRLAYLQALSCQLTQSKVKSFSIITDVATANQITDQQRAVFDQVIVMNTDLATGTIKQQNESQVFRLSPYKRTIKTEADMLFTADYSWLWDVYNPYTMLFTQTVYTYNHKKVTNRSQRKLFDDNLLPNIYSGWTYFTFDRESKKFYDTMQTIIADWAWYRDQHLVNCRYDTPRTDEVYALTAKILNIPLIDIGWGFVHMKPELQNLHRDTEWIEQLNIEIHNDFCPSIGFFRQTRPLHYQVKSFATDEIIDQYERGYRTSIR
jgi:hypothetical protein